MSGHYVRVSDHALEGMVLAASEAYVFGSGKKKKKKDSVEIYGLLWGSRRRDTDRNHIIFIDKFSVSLSARGTHKSVTPNPKAIELQGAVIERWSPHLMLLGDFHTHPCDNLAEADRLKGWNFSQNDETSFRGDDQLWKLSHPHPPMMAVMAIAKVERVYRSAGEWLDNNRWMFNVGEYRFWLSVCVGKGKSKEKRSISTSDVYLDLDPRFVNESGDRLVEKTNGEDE